VFIFDPLAWFKLNMTSKTELKLMDNATIIWFVSINRNCRYSLSYILISAFNIKIGMKNFEWKEIPMPSVTGSFYWRHLFYCVQILLDTDNGSLQHL
jgi:hypothetical protein